MKIKEFLDKIYETCGVFQKTRPNIICNDEFLIKIEANYWRALIMDRTEINYISIKINDLSVLSFFSEDEELFFEFIDKLIEKHGGININKTLSQTKWNNEYIKIIKKMKEIMLFWEYFFY